MVICDGRALGKPGDLEESFRMLKMLSGKSHEVITGVALVCKGKNFSEVWREVSRVKFKLLSDADIREYTSLVNTLDKAGAYAVQEHGELIIDRFDGELENIIGLPLIRLKQLLHELLQK
jgi:septum formation protein